jgi:O-antigen ligase
VLPLRPATFSGAAHVRAGVDVFRANAPSPRAALGAGAGLVGAGLVLWLAGGPATAGIGVLAIAAALAVYAHSYLLGPVVALLLPAGQRLDVLHGHIAPLEAVAAGGAIGYLLRSVADRSRPRLHPAHWAFAAFVVFVALSTFGPVQNSVQLHETVYWASLAVVFYAVTTGLESRRDTRLLLGALGLSILIEASLTLYEYVDRWSSRFSLLHGAIVYPLPKATLHHPNAVAQFLVLGGFALVALLLAEHNRVRQTGFVVVAIALLALVVTFSRASWIAFAAGTAVFLLERRTRRPALVLGVVVGAGAAVLALAVGGAIGSRITSLFATDSYGLSHFRTELWRRAVTIAGDHPFTGLGTFRATGDYAGRFDVATHPHNLFLGVAVFFGIPAAVALALVVLDSARASWAGFRRMVGDRRLRELGCLALLVALVVNGVFEYPFWSPPLTALVVIVLAVAAARPQRPQ